MYIYITQFTQQHPSPSHAFDRRPSVFYISFVSSAAVASSTGGWLRVWYPVRSRVQVRACASMCVQIVRCVSYYVITMHDIGRSRVRGKKINQWARETRTHARRRCLRVVFPRRRAPRLRYYKGARVELIYINAHICVHNITIYIYNAQFIHTRIWRYYNVIIWYLLYSFPWKGFFFI